MAEGFDTAEDAVIEWEQRTGQELDDDQFEALTELVENTAQAEGGATVDNVVARWQQQEEAAYDDEPEDDEPLRGEEAFQRDVTTEWQRLQNKLGRPPTQREGEAVNAGLVEQAQRYDQIDAQAALDDYHQQGGRKYDLDNREDRQAFMVERLQDAQAANAPDDSDREYDLDNRQDRIDYMVQRTQGAEFDDVGDLDDAA